MTLPELIHGLETRLKKAVELLDEEKVGKTGQSHEYYKAQTELMSFVTAHSWDILEQLERLQKMDEEKVSRLDSFGMDSQNAIGDIPT